MDGLIIAWLPYAKHLQNFNGTLVWTKFNVRCKNNQHAMMKAYRRGKKMSYPQVQKTEMLLKPKSVEEYNIIDGKNQTRSEKLIARPKYTLNGLRIVKRSVNSSVDGKKIIRNTGQTYFIPCNGNKQDPYDSRDKAPKVPLEIDYDVHQGLGLYPVPIKSAKCLDSTQANTLVSRKPCQPGLKPHLDIQNNKHSNLSSSATDQQRNKSHNTDSSKFRCVKNATQVIRPSNCMKPPRQHNSTINCLPTVNTENDMLSGNTQQPQTKSNNTDSSKFRCVKNVSQDTRPSNDIKPPVPAGSNATQQHNESMNCLPPENTENDMLPDSAAPGNETDDLDQIDSESNNTILQPNMASSLLPIVNGIPTSTAASPTTIVIASPTPTTLPSSTTMSEILTTIANFRTYQEQNTQPSSTATSNMLTTIVNFQPSTNPITLPSSTTMPIILTTIANFRPYQDQNTQPSSTTISNLLTTIANFQPSPSPITLASSTIMPNILTTIANSQPHPNPNTLPSSTATSNLLTTIANLQPSPSPITQPSSTYMPNQIIVTPSTKEPISPFGILPGTSTVSPKTSTALGLEQSKQPEIPTTSATTLKPNLPTQAVNTSINKYLGELQESLKNATGKRFINSVLVRIPSELSEIPVVIIKDPLNKTLSLSVIQNQQSPMYLPEHKSTGDERALTDEEVINHYRKFMSKAASRPDLPNSIMSCPIFVPWNPIQEKPYGSIKQPFYNVVPKQNMNEYFYPFVNDFSKYGNQNYYSNPKLYPPRNDEITYCPYFNYNYQKPTPGFESKARRKMIYETTDRNLYIPSRPEKEIQWQPFPTHQNVESQVN